MLIKTKEEIRAGVSVNLNFEMSEINPSITQAERKFLIPVLGKEFLKELDTAYNAGPLTGTIAELVKHLQAALANYAYFLYTAINSVQIGANGITEATGQNVAPARQWVTYDLKKSLLDSGDTFLDQALEFLEDNESDFETWKDSEYCTRSRELFINNAEELSRYVNIQRSRRTFLALKPFIAKAERFFIMSTISEPQFTELKLKIKAKDLSVDQQILVDLIKPAVAQLAIYKAIPEVLLNVSAEGIRVESYANGIIKKDRGSDDLIGELARTLYQDGNADLVLVKDHLVSNVDAFPAFKASKTYTDTLPLDERGSRPDWANIRGYGV